MDYLDDINNMRLAFIDAYLNEKDLEIYAQLLSGVSPEVAFHRFLRKCAMYALSDGDKVVLRSEKILYKTIFVPSGKSIKVKLTI